MAPHGQTGHADLTAPAKGTVTLPAGRQFSLRLQLPVVIAVLAATTVPIEWRVPPLRGLDLTLIVSDVVANVAGYLPVGLVLAVPNVRTAILAAALMSTLAETGQLFMMHRDPSAVDIAANVTGAAIGAFARAAWAIDFSSVAITAWRAFAAVVVAVAVCVLVWVGAPAEPNERGFSAPGGMEAHWKLDELDGRAVLDASGRGVRGRLHGSPRRVPARFGRGLELLGPDDYVEVDHSSSLRLVGSMTICAWINAAWFPRDDAAIVSSHTGVGYQLDTTIDSGARTIGFKLGDSCGRLMARYGRTPLNAGTWYHVAGTFDGRTRRLDVFLNGRLDNGPLLGAVSNTQRPSRQRVYIGRRSDSRGFEFSGVIDDVRIYSRALQPEEIAEVMGGASAQGGGAAGPEPKPTDALRSAGMPHTKACAVSDREDSRLPGLAGLLGFLIAVAAVGFHQPRSSLLAPVVSAAAGLLLVHLSLANLPWVGHWTVPLTAVAAALATVHSVRVSSYFACSYVPGAE